MAEVKLIGWKEERDETVVVFDAWSFLHVLGGMAMKNVGVSAPWAVRRSLHRSPLHLYGVEE